MVASEDVGILRLVRPLGGARPIVLNIIEIEVGEVLEPSRVRFSRSVVLDKRREVHSLEPAIGLRGGGRTNHVATQTDLEHLYVPIPDGGQIFLIHVLIFVRCDLVGASSHRNFVP